jgi:5-methyltetrahydropteroyltriglutamate--homocysteine methyltransferase
MASLPLIPATVIGSWSFPGWYAHFCDEASAHPEKFGSADRGEAVRDAVRLAVDDQLRASVDIVSDGEMQRVDFNLGFYDFLTGLRPLAPERKWGPPAHDQRNRYVCIAEIHAPKGLGCLQEYYQLRTITAAPAKVCVPGPYTLAGCIKGGDVYRNRQAVAEALLPLVNQEMRNLAAAGVEYIQLDEPSFACHPDKPDLFTDMIGATVDGVKAFVSMHLCFGNYRARAVGQRSYRPLFPHLAQAPLQELALEFASREMAEIEIAAEIKAPMRLAAGLIDVKNTWVEPPDLVASRLRQVLKHIEPERVAVTPDCGFSQTARHIARHKLENMVAGVRMVRKELGSD